MLSLLKNRGDSQFKICDASERDERSFQVCEAVRALDPDLSKVLVNYDEIASMHPGSK